MGTLAALVVVETAALHLLLSRRVPVLAWLLTASSLAVLAWIVADDRALSRQDAVRVDDTYLHLDIGRRLQARLLRADVREVLRPTWRDLGGAGPRPLNATKPAAPNVLLVLAGPRKVRIVGGIERLAERIALHVDEPEELFAILSGQP